MMLPINAKASQKTVDVLNYLYAISGSKTLTGIHNWLEDPSGYVNEINKLYGDYPGVAGYEMGPISGQTAAQVTSQRQNVTNAAKKYVQSGGIVTVMWHQNYPLTTYTWSNVQRSTTDAEFNHVCTPGTAEYNWLISEYDKVAVFLKQLRDANVPVLWRPYHEMNGGWFWWGKKQNFKLLWDIMYDRFTNFHGLNNLLWVWNANAPKSSDINPYLTHFVGTSKCDILGTDLYMYGSEPFKQEYYDGLVAISGGKPVAIAEIGQLFPSSTFAKQPKWAWFMEWANYLYDYNTSAQRYALYSTSLERMLSRSKINIPTTPIPDTQVPTMPLNLAASSKTMTSVTLTWMASTDNIGVTGYEVYVNNTNLAGTTTTTSFTVTGLTANTAYRFLVKAKDAAGNNSAFTPPLTVTTDAIYTGFVRGINFGGASVTMDEQAWLAGDNVLFTYSSNTKTYVNSPAITPVPAVDSVSSVILNSKIYASESSFTVAQALSNGNYQVYVWSLESSQTNPSAFDLVLEGSQVTTAPIGILALNSWAKYGPYGVTVKAGVLNMEVRRVIGDPSLAGMAIYTAAV
ncbi:glycosyl hydrolase [Paenibacillus anseongense]|uniref:glycosyl hydrolase n=1 Tax=Paenibacillus anseongense TaxID=2682845 RepID=UPI002DBD048D|nr:glycosyl hydrolase [Paenibacillus anseongense]MEC0264378.1 glycosyl hydrolase [Paenibacillus anseongense]